MHIFDPRNGLYCPWEQNFLNDYQLANYVSVVSPSGSQLKSASWRTYSTCLPMSVTCMQHCRGQCIITKPCKCNFVNFNIFQSNKLCNTICLRPLQVDIIFVFIRPMAVLFWHNNIFIFIRQVTPVLASWLFKTSVTSWPLTCDVGYLGANFSLTRPLCSRVRPDVCDR